MKKPQGEIITITHGSAACHLGKSTVLSDGLIQQLYSGAGDPGFLPSCQAMMPFLLFLRPGFEGREA